MKHRIAQTSRESYYIFTASKNGRTKRAHILHTILEQGPVSSRQLVRLTGIERTTITGIIRRLEDDDLIAVGFCRPCSTTKQTVRYYIGKGQKRGRTPNEAHPYNYSTGKIQR